MDGLKCNVRFLELNILAQRMWIRRSGSLNTACKENAGEESHCMVNSGFKNLSMWLWVLFFSMFNRLTKPLCVHVIVFLSHINVVSVLVVVAMVSV